MTYVCIFNIKMSNANANTYMRLSSASPSGLAVNQCLLVLCEGMKWMNLEYTNFKNGFLRP